MCSPISGMGTGCVREHFYAAGLKLSSAVRRGKGRQVPVADEAVGAPSQHNS